MNSDMAFKPNSTDNSSTTIQLHTLHFPTYSLDNCHHKRRLGAGTPYGMVFIIVSQLLSNKFKKKIKLFGGK